MATTNGSAQEVVMEDQAMGRRYHRCNSSPEFRLSLADSSKSSPRTRGESKRSCIDPIFLRPFFPLCILEA